MWKTTEGLRMRPTVVVIGWQPLMSLFQLSYSPAKPLQSPMQPSPAQESQETFYNVRDTCQPTVPATSAPLSPKKGLVTATCRREGAELSQPEPWPLRGGRIEQVIDAVSPASGRGKRLEDGGRGAGCEGPGRVGLGSAGWARRLFRWGLR